MNFFKFFQTGARKAFAEHQPEQSEQPAQGGVYLHVPTGLFGTLRYVPEVDAWRIDFLDAGQELGRWVDDGADVLDACTLFTFEVEAVA